MSAQFIAGFMGGIYALMAYQSLQAARKGHPILDRYQYGMALLWGLIAVFIALMAFFQVNP